MQVPAFDVDESGAFLMASWNNHVGWLRPDEDVAAKALALVRFSSRGVSVTGRKFT